MISNSSKLCLCVVFSVLYPINEIVIRSTSGVCRLSVLLECSDLCHFSRK